MSDRQENVVVNESTVDQEITVKDTSRNLTANENLVNVFFLERCFNEKSGTERGNIVDTVKNRMHKAIFTAIDSVVTPMSELAVRLENVSSGRDGTSVTANSEHEECIRITASLKTYPEGKTHYICSIQMMRLKRLFRLRLINCRSQEHLWSGNHTLITATGENELNERKRKKIP